MTLYYNYKGLGYNMTTIELQPKEVKEKQMILTSFSFLLCSHELILKLCKLFRENLTIVASLLETESTHRPLLYEKVRSHVTIIMLSISSMINFISFEGSFLEEKRVKRYDYSFIHFFILFLLYLFPFIPISFME